MTGMENLPISIPIPIPSITGRDYKNDIFTGEQRTIICFPIRLIQCVFKGFRSAHPGGSFLARDTTVRADSTIWSSIIGVCGQGMMIEGLSKSYLNNCTFTNCSNIYEVTSISR
jgi:hypothetical protein